MFMRCSLRRNDEIIEFKKKEEAHNEVIKVAQTLYNVTCV